MSSPRSQVPLGWADRSTLAPGVIAATCQGPASPAAEHPSWRLSTPTDPCEAFGVTGQLWGGWGSRAANSGLLGGRGGCQGLPNSLDPAWQPRLDPLPGRALGVQQQP